MDGGFLKELVDYRMPYGKYKGKLIIEMPTHYLEWIAREGFPQGKLGQMLATMYEIRTNGLMDLLKPLIRNRR